MKIDWKWLMEQIDAAEVTPATIAIPLAKFDTDDLLRLADAARKKELELRVWSEHSNYSQDVLVEIQRFKARYRDTTKPQITYLN